MNNIKQIIDIIFNFPDVNGYVNYFLYDRKRYISCELDKLHDNYFIVDIWYEYECVDSVNICVNKNTTLKKIKNVLKHNFEPMECVKMQKTNLSMNIANKKNHKIPVRITVSTRFGELLKYFSKYLKHIWVIPCTDNYIIHKDIWLFYRVIFDGTAVNIPKKVKCKHISFNLNKYGVNTVITPTIECINIDNSKYSHELCVTKDILNLKANNITTLDVTGRVIKCIEANSVTNLSIIFVKKLSTNIFTINLKVLELYFVNSHIVDLSFFHPLFRIKVHACQFDKIKINKTQKLLISQHGSYYNSPTNINNTTSPLFIINEAVNILINSTYKSIEFEIKNPVINLLFKHIDVEDVLNSNTLADPIIFKGLTARKVTYVNCNMPTQEYGLTKVIN